MSWQAASLTILALVLLTGFAWFERSQPSARIVAAVAALAALGVAGRVALAPIPNVVATTDVALLAGYALGGGPGFAVGALSGLISNFWLGQGPWTPWQMAGWGAVGLGGAVLASVSGRRLGRLQLAVAAAVAGLLYGALLDLSVMVSYGGEQSLDRYLALSARGVPFNIAHAAGNFALMIAAGPALVRMLDRYRGRFQHRWSDTPLGRVAAAIAVSAALAVPLAAPTESSAGDAGDAEAWLLASRNDDGGFGSEGGASSSVEMTGWAILGMEAAGTNPRDVPKYGTGPIEYLRRHEAEITSAGDLERTILGLEAAGLDSREWEGRDLVYELRKLQNGNGSYEQQTNLTAFAILAQRAAGVDGSNVKKPAEWLLTTQNNNGGWGSVKGAESEPDSTGAVLQALAVAPVGGKKMDDAVQWLARAQHASGGWSLTPKATPNTQSTAWAVQGIAAAGKAPGQVKTSGNGGPDFIAARQASDGHYTYSKASDQTPTWVTSQGLMGARHAPFPLEPVKREKPDKPDDGTNRGDGGYDGYDSGSSGYDGYSGSSYDGYDGGTDYSPGSFGGSGNSGGNPSSGKDGGAPNGAPAGEPEGEISPANEATDQFEQAASPTEALPAQSSPLPQTFVFLAGLGGLAAAFGGGFIWFRRRLP